MFGRVRYASCSWTYVSVCCVHKVITQPLNSVKQNKLQDCVGSIEKNDGTSLHVRVPHIYYSSRVWIVGFASLQQASVKKKGEESPPPTVHIRQGGPEKTIYFCRVSSVVLADRNRVANGRKHSKCSHPIRIKTFEPSLFEHILPFFV